MVIESDTTTWSSGSKRWRLHAGSTVEDSCGTLYQHVVTGSSSIGVVSLGTTSPWGGALEDVPVVATTADIVPSTLTILKVTGTYQKCKKKKTIYIVLILITFTVSQWRYFWWIGCISLWLVHVIWTIYEIHMLTYHNWTHLIHLNTEGWSHRAGRPEYTVQIYRQHCCYRRGWGWWLEGDFLRVRYYLTIQINVFKYHFMEQFKNNF